MQADMFSIMEWQRRIEESLAQPFQGATLSGLPTHDFDEQALEFAMDTVMPPTGTIYQKFDELEESPNISEQEKQFLEAGKGLVIGLVLGKVLFG